MSIQWSEIKGGWAGSANGKRLGTIAEQDGKWYGFISLEETNKKFGISYTVTAMVTDDDAERVFAMLEHLYSKLDKVAA